MTRWVLAFAAAIYFLDVCAGLTQTERERAIGEVMQSAPFQNWQEKTK